MQAIDRLKYILTDEAGMIPPGMPALNRKNAIVEWIDPFFETDNYEFWNDELEVKGAGDWAVEHASFTSRLIHKDDYGSVSEHHGKYIIIWRWEKDNKWRIERYLDNSDPE